MSKFLSLALVLIVLAPTFIFSVISGHAMIGNTSTSDTEYHGSGRKETKRTTQEEECPKGYRGSGRKGNPDCVLITKTSAGRLSESNFSTGNRTNKPTRKVSAKPTQKEVCYRGSGRLCISTKKSTNSSNKPTRKSSNVSFELVTADNCPTANNIIQLNNSNGDIYKVNKIYNGCKASLTNCKTGSTSTLPLIGKRFQQADAKC